VVPGIRYASRSGSVLRGCKDTQMSLAGYLASLVLGGAGTAWAVRLVIGWLHFAVRSA